MAETNPPSDSHDENAHSTTTPPPVEPAVEAGAAAEGVLSGDAKTMVTLAHGLGIICLVFPALVIWLLKKEELPAIEPQCKETINFQITAFGLIFILGVVLGWIPIVGWCITLPLALIVWLGTIIMLIMATVAASNGQPYKFFWKIDLI